MEQKENKNFLNINWRARANNPQWWIKIVLSILVIPIVYTGSQFSDMNTWGDVFGTMGEAYSNPAIAVACLIALYNSITENTSKGFGDLAVTQSILKPFTDKDPKEILALKNREESSNTPSETQAEPKENKEDVEVVDGVDGKEISDGDMKDALEQQDQTAEYSFDAIDNMEFGDKAEPQNVGNDTEEEYKEKVADADIKGDEIKG